MIRKMPAATPFPSTIEEYATRVAAWCSYQFKLDEGEAARLVNAFPTIVAEAWDSKGMRADPQGLPRRYLSHIDWLAESMTAEGKTQIAQKLLRLYTHLAYPRLRKKKQPMPEIP